MWWWLWLCSVNGVVSSGLSAGVCFCADMVMMMMMMCVCVCVLVLFTVGSSWLKSFCTSLTLARIMVIRILTSAVILIILIRMLKNHDIAVWY